MILLKPDHLLFKTSEGDMIPCSAEVVALEMLGETAANLDLSLVKNAAAAVLHYFREELHRESVSVAEFSEALEHVLKSFGVTVHGGEPAAAPKRIVQSDLVLLVNNPPEFLELAFFPRLRRELSRQLQESPDIVKFIGLRSCVKKLLRARRWNRRCQVMSDQIVEYLRSCLHSQSSHGLCAMVVRQ